MNAMRAHLTTPSAPSALRARSHRARANRPTRTHASMKGLVFDLGGVFVEPSEHHRQAYNEAFRKYEVLPANSPTTSVVQWNEGFYQELVSRSGVNGDFLLQYYFDAYGWGPNSLNSGKPPRTEEEKQQLLSALLSFKSSRFDEMVMSGEVSLSPRDGVLRVLDEASQLDMKLAVTSTAAARDTMVETLNRLLGVERVSKLDCILAGDDVPTPKPNPSIYKQAAARMSVQPQECVCVEESTQGLEAALKAGMRAVVCYTEATKTQAFEGAERVVSSLGFPANITAQELKQQRIAQDDRVGMDVTDDAVYWLMNPGSYKGGL